MATIKDTHTPKTDLTRIGTVSEALVRLEVTQARTSTAAFTWQQAAHIAAGGDDRG